MSIVTPCFNSEAFLEQTILSVARQTYGNIEYIVVDGGSADRTVDIIRQHEAVISRWTSEPDSGQGDALRKGFHMANGVVLAWVNSDDVYPPDAVATAVAALRRTGADLVYGNRGVIDGEGLAIGERRLSPFLPYFSRRGVLYGGFGIYQPAAFWTRDLYHRVGGIDSTYSHCMDTELVARFAMAGARFKFIRKDLVAFRLHAESKTSTLARQMREERDRIEAALPQRAALYRSMIRLVCRAWRVLYDVRDSQGRYMLGRVLDRKYRYLQ